jgi:large subunit ribosomal protein L22
MTFTAHTIVNYSPQKSRLITNSLKGLTLDNALAQLSFMTKGKTKLFYNLIKNAANNIGLSEKDYANYFIDTFIAEEAQKLFRSMPKAKGSAARIIRRYSRLKILVLPKM